MSAPTLTLTPRTLGKEEIEAFVAQLAELTSDEREQLFVALRIAFCIHCGSRGPGCQCMNDE